MDNHKKLFSISSFAVVGISTTCHGVALVNNILQAGLRPKFALISAATSEQLNRSRTFWTIPEWWEKAAEEILDPSVNNKQVEKENGCIEQVYLKNNIPYLFVPGLESKACLDILAQASVDALLLAEYPILKGKILDAAPCGIINLHAAPLPEYRGNYATYWALYHDEPLRVSAHLVEGKADAGPILATRPLPVEKGATLADIDKRGFEECGKLAAEVLMQALDSEVSLQQQAAWQGHTFHGQMPEEIIEECERRLSNHEYSHYEQ